MSNRLKSIILTTIILSLNSSVTLATNLSIPKQTLAQAATSTGKKAEADKLLQQGIKQSNTKQIDAALQSFQQALTIYKEIKDRPGQGKTLNNLGNIYSEKKDNAKAIKAYQESLIIAREIKDRDLEARNLLNLGSVYSSMNNYDKALDLLQQSWQIAQEIKSRVLQFKLLELFIQTYTTKGNTSKANEYKQQAQAMFAEIIKFGEVLDLQGKATAYNQQKKYQEAIESGEKALENLRKIQLKNEDVLILFSSLNLDNKSISPEFIKFLFETQILEELALAYRAISDYPKLINVSQQRLEIVQKTKFNEDEWEFLLTISSLSGTTKESNLLEVYKKYPELEANLGLARAYNISGEYQKAILSAQQALQVAREVKNSTFEASALLILASASSSLAISNAEYQNSLKFAQQALTIARQIKDLEFESEALNYIAYIYRSLEEYPKALEFAETSLAVARKSKDPWAVYDPLLNLAITYGTLGDYSKMNQYSQEALMTARKISQDPKFEVIALNLIALNQFLQGNYQKTITSAQEALVVSKKIKIIYTQKNFYYGIYQILSLAYGGLNDYQKAIEFTQKSLEVARDLKEPGSEGSALVSLGDFYRLSGQKQEAITIYNQVLNLAKRVEYSGSLALVNLGLARTYRDLNQPTTAITFYQKTIDDIEKTRGRIRGLSKELQTSFVESIVDTERNSVADVYREYANLLLSQGRTLEANQVLELLKVQELSEFRNSPKTAPVPKPVLQTPVEAKLIEKYGSLIAFGQRFDECQKNNCQENNQLYEERDGLFAEFRQTIVILEKDTRDRLSKDDDSLKPQDVRAVGKKIVEAKEGTVLINIFIVQDKTWLLWVSKGGVVKSVEVNVGESKIRDTVKKFRQLLQNDQSDINEVKATGKQLYDWLIKPIEQELKANKINNLVFSLDRSARYIPMSALFDGKQYLIENYSISTILSANLTDTTERLPTGVENTPVLALGLSKAVSGFDALSNVPAELDGIVRQNPTDSKGIYPGNKFLDEKFNYRTLQNNLGGHKILHLATHGVFLSGRRDESYLLLGTGEKLAIPQIDNLEALSNIHLVVLSACETALGETGNDGIEISGISNSFLNRQAKAVMASLWVVADKSTSILMQQFYTNLASSNHPTKAEALRQAQLSLLYGQNLNKQNVKERGGLTPILPPGKSPTNRQHAANFSHPYYWAPFILIGNGL
jgi:CHAT domain-containing protein